VPGAWLGGVASTPDVASTACFLQSAWLLFFLFHSAEALELAISMGAQSLHHLLWYGHAAPPSAAAAAAAER
jgi:hypothetical protein